MVPSKTVGLKSVHYEEFQESRVHYTLVGIKSLLKIRERGFLGAKGGFRNPWTPPLATPLCLSGKLRTRFTSPIQNPLVPGYRTFFLCSLRDLFDLTGNSNNFCLSTLTDRDRVNLRCVKYCSTQNFYRHTLHL